MEFRIIWMIGTVANSMRRSFSPFILCHKVPADPSPICSDSVQDREKVGGKRERGYFACRELVLESQRETLSEWGKQLFMHEVKYPSGLCCAYHRPPPMPILFTPPPSGSLKPLHPCLWGFIACHLGSSWGLKRKKVKRWR